MFWQLLVCFTWIFLLYVIFCNKFKTFCNVITSLFINHRHLCVYVKNKILKLIYQRRQKNRLEKLFVHPKYLSYACNPSLEEKGKNQIDPIQYLKKTVCIQFCYYTYNSLHLRVLTCVYHIHTMTNSIRRACCMSVILYMCALCWKNAFIIKKRYKKDEIYSTEIVQNVVKINLYLILRKMHFLS